MAEDLELEQDVDEVEIPDIVAQMFAFAADEAKSRIEAEGPLAPFTATLVRDTVYFDTFSGETPEEIYEAAAQKIVEMDGATTYAFVFDGWIEGDEGEENADAVILEGGVPGDSAGYAVCLRYTVNDEGAYEFAEHLEFVGDAPNYMEFLSEPDPWDPEEEGENA